MDPSSQQTELASPIYIPGTPSASPEPRYIPPRPSPNDVLLNILDSGEPISPRTGATILGNPHYDNLAPHVAGRLARAVALGALEFNERAVTLVKATEASAADVVRSGAQELKRKDGLASAFEQRIKELEDENAERERAFNRLQDHISTLEDKLDQADECPEGFVGNCGRAPEFRIPCDGGFSLQARYIKPLSNGLVAGTMGGLNDEVYVHELLAEPRVTGANPVPILAPWFINLAGAESRQYDALLGEAKALDDWGLTADIERYHAQDLRMAIIAQQVRRLRDEEEQAQFQRDQAHYRLARAEASYRLGSLEALSPLHQRGITEGRRFPGRCHKRARGRASFEG